jgi:hypothetical protein
MIWATAWSFDCLKNWIENGRHPKQAIKAQLTFLISCVVLSLIWIYQGLIPKLLFTNSGELEILKHAGWFEGHEKKVLTLIAWAEILLGFIILIVHKKSIHIINILALLLLLGAALVSNTVIFTFPFNPFSLSISMIALSVIAIINFEGLPRASNCISSQK